MTRTILLAVCLLAGCTDSPEDVARKKQQAEYANYNGTRVLARTCLNGTQVWRWRGDLWIYDAYQWPGARVESIETVCQP